MFIEKFKNNGIDYLRLVHSYRYTRNDGVRTVKKKAIYNIGSLSKFDDGKPNYLSRLKESYKNGNPIIPELFNYLEKESPIVKYNFQLSPGDPNCIGHPKWYSHCLFERILEELGLISLFNRYKSLTNYKFDLVGFFRLLVYSRILSPCSKIATVKLNEDYYDPIISAPYQYNVYDTLDFIHKYEKSIVNKMNKHLIKSFGRTTNIIRYDVTNFFCFTDRPDPDIEENGTIIKGLRKKGVSKEERSLPIIQMGLFMDDQGLPISIEMFPGNTLDHLTVETALANTIDNLDMPRYILVSDRGIYNKLNVTHLLKRNHGYIMAKSIDKTNESERAWIYDQGDYINVGDDFKHKSIIRKRKFTSKDGEDYHFSEKVVVYWSKKFHDKQKAEHKSFLEFIEKLKDNPSSFRITKAQSNSLKRFLRDDVTNKKTGEILNSNDLTPLIDFTKLQAFIDHLGYYQLVTSELEMPDNEVISKYHELVVIESHFYILKGNLDIRPVYLQNEEHIKAHLLICMIALTIIRIIQNRIVDHKGKDAGKLFQMGLSGERLQRALSKWTVEVLANDFYRFNNIDDHDLKLILDAFNIKIPTKLYTKSELKSLKKEMNIFK